jgi:hypothetical protein
LSSFTILLELFILGSDSQYQKRVQVQHKHSVSPKKAKTLVKIIEVFAADFLGPCRLPNYALGSSPTLLYSHAN